MTDPAAALGLATAGVVVFLWPALALFFGGIPSRREALWLAVIAVASVLLATGEWMLFGQPPSVALFQGTLATVAVLTVAAVGLRTGRGWPLVLTLALWLTVVHVPLAYSIFDLEGGAIAAHLGTLDFAGAAALGVIPGTAAIAIALAHRWSGVRIEGQPRRPGWLLAACAVAGILGFLAVAVGAELVIDSTTLVLAANTLLGAAGGAVGWTAAQIANVHRASLAGIVAGLFAGVVVTLPASPWLEPVAVVVLALIASIVGHITTIAFRSRASKQAWASIIGVLLVPGAVGLIGAGIVAAGPGLLYSGHADLAEAQLQGLAVVLVASFVVTLAVATAVYVGASLVRASRP